MLLRKYEILVLVCCASLTYGYGTVGTAVDVSPFASLSECGPDSLTNKIYGGTNADLTDFPWMALLEFQADNSDKRQFGCSGSLINHRYVVTAAHCIFDSKQKSLSVVNIRLGEYDTASEMDCVQEDCADPVVNVAVEKIVVHELYDGFSSNKVHDIALIRLASDVAYTDFISPICMPSVVGLGRTEPEKFLTASGWGRTLRAKSSAVKQKVELPIVSQPNCTAKYAKIRTVIEDTQLCAGGLYAVDTCDGDSGGPLMAFKDVHWVIEGIVSFGYKCGLEDWPAIYTRVAEYEPWIRQTIHKHETTSK